MTHLYMGTRPWVRMGVVVLPLALWLSAPAPASAEPSAACRDLAARFATGAAELDLGALAGLMTCVSAEMGARTGSAAGAPPSESPAPPPSPPVAREYGEWPASTPWGPSGPPIGPDVR